MAIIDGPESITQAEARAHLKAAEGFLNRTPVTLPMWLTQALDGAPREVVAKVEMNWRIALALIEETGTTSS